LRRRLRELPEGQDLERVHQARIATRRLREAIRLFGNCFSLKKRRRWGKQIRRLTKALGPARDADVQVEYLRGLLAGLDDRRVRPGIRRVLLRLQQRREALQPRVTRAAGRFRKTGVLMEMMATADKMLAPAPGSQPVAAGPVVRAEVRWHILERLKNVLACRHCLASSADIAGHHAMRIAVKRLRYSLEICGDLYDGGLDESIQAQKGLQTLLGDLHDCDVWAEHLRQFTEDERRRTQKYFGHPRPFNLLKPGVDHLASHERDRRERLFGEVCAAWREFTDRGIWDRLVRTVQAPEGPGPEDRAAVRLVRRIPRSSTDANPPRLNTPLGKLRAMSPPERPAGPQFGNTA
jgi:CHAD domain-containing protein